MITAKFRAFYDVGVRAFSLLLDDILPDFIHEADRAQYASYANAQAALCNRVYHWLKDLDPAITLSMCPTDYHGVPPFGSYLQTLGAELDPGIDVFYTGPQLCSKTITSFDAAAFAQAVRRSPIIWDNYPVNDGEMASEMHLGPIQGRDSTLYHAARGILVNPMTQVEASKIALATYGKYMANPLRYDAQSAWECALLESVGPGSFNALGTFAENSMTSCLDAPAAVTLEEMVEVAVLMMQDGCGPSECPVVDDLEAYLDHIDDACYHLLNEMDNVVLRTELIPWIDLLQRWVQMARRAIQVLRALETGEKYEPSLQRMNALLDEIQKHPKRIAGRSLLLLSAYTLEQVSQQIGSVDFSVS
jgi:hyaluronoglucosaminidase